MRIGAAFRLAHRRPTGVRTSRSTPPTWNRCSIDAPTSVAHSYGTLGALIAAERSPAQVRSLTLIEPPLYFLAAGDQDVVRFQRMGDACLTHGLDTEPATLREFLRIAGAPVPDKGPLPQQVVHSVRRGPP
jgi:pimeloyl-ACP methyl ester carboxylesterase